jgi:hypothetical protein
VNHRERRDAEDHGCVLSKEASYLTPSSCFLGFPLRLPVHREDLTEADAARVFRQLRPPAHAVLITYLAEAVAVAELYGGPAPGSSSCAATSPSASCRGSGRSHKWYIRNIEYGSV